MGETLGGQAHSHPTDAYHSDTDDHLALVTLLGAISLVVPDFAARRQPSADWFWARLVGAQHWAPVSDTHRHEINDLFVPSEQNCRQAWWFSHDVKSSRSVGEAASFPRFKYFRSLNPETETREAGSFPYNL